MRFVTPALLAIALAGSAVACAQPTAATSPPLAQPAPAATGGATTFCGALADVSTMTRAIATKDTISPAEYSATADAYDRLGALAPSELKPDLATVAKDYRAVASGATTIEKIGPEIASASLRLTDANMRLCAPTAR